MQIKKLDRTLTVENTMCIYRRQSPTVILKILELTTKYYSFLIYESP